MKITTGGNLLNFGYWTDKTNNPLQAQIKLTTLLGEYGSFENAKTVLDVGSGFSIPALQWICSYPHPNFFCVNISLQQLSRASKDIIGNKTNAKLSNLTPNAKERIFHINATSTMLPFKGNSMERVIAFESAHHFKPLERFIAESSRILKKSGLLILAMPVLRNLSNRYLISKYLNLGILSVTWASEHYNIELITTSLIHNGFKIKNMEFIGSKVYGPLADYYIKNRSDLRTRIIKEYPSSLELILHKSMKKMKIASDKKDIDYLLLKASKE